MPRCIAKKNNGTQCKCNAVIGSLFCGTHQNWMEVITIDNSTSIEGEWTNMYQPHYIPSVRASKVCIDDMIDIIGR